METEKTIHNLKLHENILIDHYNVVTRVPGGWVYETSNCSTFVPYSDEFKEARDLYLGGKNG
tara:strand:- start:1898 stop:2083 length:186 start_codon:yes stop_codon:yes gene_type:complete